jgi:enoyl-[acyl-carrier-protein] reductase (NADH)
LIGRYATPEEIANMAVILVSDMSRTIIGDTIFMSGGGGIITNEDVDFKF